MARQGDGRTISAKLKPGKCLYKFIVDGKQVIDPDNKNWDQSEPENSNSVLWIA